MRTEIENDRLRHIRLHERVNDLPDPNYATLKYLMGHLDLCVPLPVPPTKNTANSAPQRPTK